MNDDDDVGGISGVGGSGEDGGTQNDDKI